MTTDTNLQQATTQFASVLLREVWIKKWYFVVFGTGFIVGVAKERGDLVFVVAVIFAILCLILLVWKLWSNR